MVNKDFIIVLAWPELMCKLPGSWYDFFFRKTGKVRGGHSAIILVNSRNKRLYYMDNGRYHSPIGYSRIRDEETDHDIKISLLAKIKNDEILYQMAIVSNACYCTGRYLVLFLNT